MGGSGVVMKSSARAGGPMAAALVGCGGWRAVMVTSVRLVWWLPEYLPSSQGWLSMGDFGDFGVPTVMAAVA